MALLARLLAAAAALWIVGAGGLASAAISPVRIIVDTLRVAPDARRIEVHLRSDIEVGHVRHTLVLPQEIFIAARPDGRPACGFAAWPDERTAPLTATSFTFLPPECTPGFDCNAVSNVFFIVGAPSALPDGSTTYWCELSIDATPPGSYPIVVSDIDALDSNGQPLAAAAVNGAVIVEAPAVVEAPTIRGLPGTRHRLDLTLRTDVEVAGTGHHLAFDPQTAIAARPNGRPACARGNDVPRPAGVGFDFTPSGCHPGATCTGMRALVLVLDGGAPIPDRTVLYSCELDIAADVPPGVYPLVVSGVEASDLHGARLLAGGSDGAVIVEAPTPTPTATVLPVAATPSPIATTPPMPTHTRRSVDDGCATVPPRSDARWLLLPLLLALPLTRRRNRVAFW